MSLRLHELAEADHRILNPFTHEKLMLLGEICRLQAGQRMLDLACGKGEMLSRWASRFGIGGVGVDLSEVFLSAARARAVELGVSSALDFVQADAATYQAEAASFDVAACIGATWIGNGLAGTLDLLRPALRADGLLLIGEPFWHAVPSPEALEAFGLQSDQFTSLAGTADRLSGAGVELVEMVLSDADSWDRYVAGHWWTLDRWLRANPEDPDAPAARVFMERERDSHLRYGRQLLGWGVFVGRLRG